MKLIRFLPEGLCLSLYMIFMMLLIQSLTLSKNIAEQIDIISALESIIPQQTAEILNTNFHGNLHYDLYSQFQLEIEQLMLKLSNTSTSIVQLKQYNHATAHYMQLVTMLKTSRKLIALSNVKNKQLHASINNELLKFIISPDDRQSAIFSSFLMQNVQPYTSVSDAWLATMQHAQFIIDKSAVASQLIEAIKSSEISSYMANERSQLQQQYQHTLQLKWLYGFIIILSFVLIFIVILKRQQKSLVQQSKLAKAAAETKSQFLANMSHEIRTPLTGIIGLSELCLETELKAEQKEYLDKSLFSANSLLRIINDILDFSKIEENKLALEYIDFEHEKLFENLEVMLGKTASDKGIEIIYHLDPNIASRLNCDPVRLGQILLNLLSNAIKFTEQGHILVAAKVIDSQSPVLDEENSKAADTYQVIEYRIEDTGIGLSKEHINKLFNRFVQADESTTRKYGGSGLGLTICRSLAALMKGSIKVESQLDVGSTFILTLPLKVSQQSASNKTDFHKVKNKQLLLLEDNQITQDIISKLAAYLNMKIETTDKVNTAIKYCQEKQYDFALVDWHLTRENGLDFIKQVKRAKYIPKDIIICSAFNHNDIEDREQLLKEHKFLSKPFTISRFYQTLTSSQSTESATIPDHQTTSQQAEPIEQTLQKQHGRVLLVEDNRINQTIATTILKNLNLSVDLAEDGLTAIMKIKTNYYDVVLMDIRMPVMDGIEATKELRQHYDKNELVIIALTANVTKEEIDNYLRIGMNGHLSKPYNKQMLKEELSRYIKFPKG